ncbi:HNH endonuclease [Georgenia wangjunii]|uniref:HNH endonuclease n=1 Tax=Georgenia wangjunii TaxID=3117730 RepID=UPI002F25F183
MRAEVIASWVAALAGTDRGVDDGERVEQIRALEDLKAAACAAQARAAVDLDASQRAAQAAAGVPAARRGAGVASQVALARRESPYTGGRHLGLAKALVLEMPHTHAALSAGRISEWRATLLVRESACLTRPDRATFDELMAANLPDLESAGDRRLIATAKKTAYTLDAGSVVARARKAETERTVTLRPAPDTMSYLTALVPVAQGVAAWANLTRTAETLRATGDERSRGQIMADTLIERLTGQTTAEDTRLEVQLVMTDHDLFHTTSPTTRRGTTSGPATSCGPDDDSPESDSHQTGSSTGDGDGDRTSTAPPGRSSARDDGATKPSTDPDAGTGAGTGGKATENDDNGGTTRGDGTAHVPGYGPVPAAWARELITRRLTCPDAVWIRRLYLTPTTGQLIAMDSRSRLAPPGLARFIDTRDQTCRTPWCDAPIRHHDHIRAHADGGPTTADNLQGLCETCNYTKQAPGWTARTTTPPNGPHTVTTRTPTGHEYHSHAPPLPGAPPPATEAGAGTTTTRGTSTSPTLGTGPLTTATQPPLPQPPRPLPPYAISPVENRLIQYILTA